MNTEETNEFIPKFNDDGLIPCITISQNDGAVLMMAWMNRESLKLTIDTNWAHYWSRSRCEIWKKGATSGNTQKVVSLKTDCDQDCILMSVEAAGDSACHTGRRSCFYRTIDGDKLIFCDD